jgi:hypothetical protein
MARRFRVFTCQQNPFTDVPVRYVRAADYQRLLAQPGTKHVNETGDIQIAAAILDDRRPERVIPRSATRGADRGPDASKMDNRRTWKARESGGVRVMQMVRDAVAPKYFAYNPSLHFAPNKTTNPSDHFSSKPCGAPLGN